MKLRDRKEMKQKPVAELEKAVGESRERLRKMLHDLEGGKVKNVSEIRELKKDIARMLTFIGIAKRPGTRA